MFDKLKVWFLGLGPFLYELVTSVAGGFVKKYGPRALEIVMQVATMPGTGPEKMAKASALLMAEVPGMTVWAANTVIQTAYAVYMSRQENIDTDGDGVPDYRDMCKDLGAPPGGCVTAEGCPDADCDGAAAYVSTFYNNEASPTTFVSTGSMQPADDSGFVPKIIMQ